MTTTSGATPTRAVPLFAYVAGRGIMPQFHKPSLRLVR